MQKKVFISGSIRIESLPKKVCDVLDIMMSKNLSILVGDAAGVDSEIQNYLNKNNYTDVNVYTIYDKARHKKSNSFKEIIVKVDESLKKERERQIKKDEIMTSDSDYSLVIWDGKSKGSYGNILRAISQGKFVKVFMYSIDDFLLQSDINESYIQYIFNENNGYTSSELLEQLHNQGIDFFNNTRELNRYLVDNNILYKEDSFYLPVKRDDELFKLKFYKGKNTGVLFTNKFIDWIIDKVKSSIFEQQNSFDF